MSQASRHQNIQIIPKRVFFSILKHIPRNEPNLIYFSIENDPHFMYKGFYDDFGPPSILQLYSFSKMLDEFMQNNNTILHFYSSSNQNTKSNSILYISAFRMLHLGLIPDEAFKPFSSSSIKLKPFRDASTLPSTFDLTILDCLNGLHRAIHHGWFNYQTFDPNVWAKNEEISFGDMNWIIPNKLLAFASPYSSNILPGGFHVATPKDLIPVFKEMGINHVIRLNKPFYDSNIFVESGFIHTELYFLDGSVPPVEILDKFLSIAETNDIIALHCKAGLGRTGTLAACYLVKNFGFSARESIGWIRLCRSGSIIGPQQQFIVSFHDDIKRPMTENNKIQLNRVSGPKSSRFVYSPSKGFPLDVDEIKGKNIKSPRWIRNDCAKIQIKRPFNADQQLCVRAIPINSFHPQPRKVGQREPARI